MTNNPNLTKLQNILKAKNIDAILIRSTDEFLNEYVPEKLSFRKFFTGFSGSVGDAIVTPNDSYLFVDGRYGQQAKNQAPWCKLTVSGNSSIENSWLLALGDILPQKGIFSLDPKTIDNNLFEKIEKSTNKQVKITPDATSIFAEISDLQKQASTSCHIWPVPKNLSGASCQEKLASLWSAAGTPNFEGFLLTKLDDIAWICNLRGDYFPFQMTFPSIAAVLKNQILLGLLATPKETVEYESPIKVVDAKNFHQELKKLIKSHSLAFEPSQTTKHHLMSLKEYEIHAIKGQNLVQELKSIKNDSELQHMRQAFKKADEVVNATIRYVKDSYKNHTELTELDIKNQLEKNFQVSGAKALSFSPICAGGQNGSIIHYGSANGEKKLSSKQMFLLDTGAYYEGGYATDLTRTFLLGSKEALSWQKRMFTLVLKASIAGLSARIKKGTTGKQLDAIVRNPLWQEGIDFAHGTGHGVGINVHEFPPRIAGLSNTPLQKHQVFSIEPGIYVENVGGVRIENLATLVDDPQNKDFLRVLPLTFCPLDEDLIDENLLTSQEKNFLCYYQKEWKSTSPMPELFPLTTCDFSRC